MGRRDWRWFRRHDDHKRDATGRFISRVPRRRAGAYAQNVVDQVFQALGVGAFDEERPAPANAWQARLAGNAVFRSEVIC
jgi:hypothetical protein